ncbi:acidstable alpha-amylase [Pelomyxa schiedti]|nr:acidstable alpha-amylase [Pelomyxa schiedti]
MMGYMTAAARLIVVAAVLLVVVNGVQAKSSTDWKKRIVYRIVTDRFGSGGNPMDCDPSQERYCGGTWAGIQKRLGYIQSMGFDAIWISSVTSNTKNGYHGYWPLDYTQVNTNFGTATDLLNLMAACHAKDILVMVDFIPNNVGPVNYSFTSVVPFNDPSHYHSCDSCPTGCAVGNWLDQTQLENCRLGGLPDLNQTNPYVLDQTKSLIGSLTKTYEIDGVGLANFNSVPLTYWDDIIEASTTYCLSDVNSTNITYAVQYQNGGTLKVNGVLNHVLYQALLNSFVYKKSFSYMNTYASALYWSDKTIEGNFIDNIDFPRFLSIDPDVEILKNILAYLYLASGIPVIYYGTEQGFSGGAPPMNQEPLWTSDYNTTDLMNWMYKLSVVRKQVQVFGHSCVQQSYSTNYYTWICNALFVVVTNLGSNSGTVTYSINSPFTNGKVICNVLSETPDCQQVTQSKVVVSFVNGRCKAFLATVSS